MQNKKIDTACKLHITHQLARLSEISVFNRWNSVLSYSSGFNTISQLSHAVRSTLCRPDDYFYVKDGIIDTYNKIKDGDLLATKEDFKALKRLTNDLISGEFDKFINDTSDALNL
jgi:hypothetical protein